MFTALQDSVIELVARGERGVPGTPGDYDYETADAAASQNIPIIRKTLTVGGRHTTLDKGRAAYVRVAVQPTHPGKFQSLDGGWWELNDPFPNVRQFGARGDNVTDDTNAIQDAFDYCVTKSCMVRVPKGSYVVGPLAFNGRTWAAAPSTVGPQPSARGLIGEGGIFFGARFVAKVGAYTSGQAVITGRNLTFKVITGIHIDCNFVADVGLDVAWIGTADGSGGGAAPACGNEFTNMLIENAVSMGANFDQAADCLIQNISYRGGTPPIAFSLRLNGGAIQANNLRAYRGRWVVACQNAQFSDSLMLGGLQIVSSAVDNIALTSCQLSTDPETGYTVYSNTDPGFGTQCIFFNTCYFLGGSTHTYYFAGRWGVGAKFVACEFSLKPTTTMFDAANFTPIQGASFPPVFDFEGTSFFAGNVSIPATLQFPQSIPGKVLVGTYFSKRPDGVTVSRRAFPADIQVGDGLIGADKVSLTAAGFFGRGQGVSSPPTDSYFGLGYNRSAGGNEVELSMRGDLWRLVTFDGATFTTRLTFNAGASNGFYPGTDNTRNLGIASNRWATVFAGSSTISTSDARLKTPIEPLTENELAAAVALAEVIGTFRFLEAQTAKGEDARTHVGLTVQRAIEIMEEHDLDPLAYGFICHDEWPEQVTEYPAAYDEDGNEIRPAYTERQPGGDIYSFRADELQFFIARGQEQRLKEQNEQIGLQDQRLLSQETLLASQEERIAALELALANNP